MNIKIFLIKVIVLSALSWGTIEAFFYFDPYKKHDFETSYNAIIIDKYKILQETPSPKVVLIAGSNFAYGINSKLLADSLKKPVVNMAIHYNYGSKFMLKQLESELKKGDTVIMGFEYIIESKGNISEQMLMARYFPKAHEWIEYDDIFERIRAYSLLRIKVFRVGLERLIKQNKIDYSINDTTSVFFRGAANQYGDLVSHYNNPRFKTIPRAILSDKMSLKESIQDMNLFYKTMKARGVEVYFVYPTYSEENYALDKPIIEKYKKEYDSLAVFPILGKPTDFVFADSLYHDMAYHLTQKGGDIRTGKIIQLLRKK
ncbi:MULTISPECIES: hypothetical protein [Emticicia]|uniref:hypothetical protein n=1 Tax=Emticicia TaxID=312278 RepID=UPI0007D8A6A3|nr:MULTISPECIES: hypothetical protein [Emticicia]